jgi:zinc transporter
MDHKNGFIFAYLLDGKGGAKKLSFKEVKSWHQGDGTLWLHCNYTDMAIRKWLKSESGINPLIVEALTAIETRSRNLLHKNALMVILRGVNLNPNNEPQDMISVRCWLEADRIITLRNRFVLAVNDLSETLQAGSGPVCTGHFLTELADSMINRMNTVIADVDDEVDAFEDKILMAQSVELRQKIADIRRTVIGLRRHLAPQRETMTRLPGEAVDWLSDENRMRLREASDRTTRYVEDLEAIRERATIAHEELNNKVAEQMNRTMYMLSIVTGIFLPLGLLTGLFGINIAGMPGTDNPWAFSLFCLAMALIATAQILFFKHKKWM